MKTAIKKSLVLAVLLLATAVSYGNEISYNVNDGKRVKTNLTFKDVKKGSVLLIKDNNGLVLYKELIKIEGNYSKGFDLTALPDGDYYFELDNDTEIKVVPFKVAANVVAFDKAAEMKYFKPNVNVIKGKVFVSKLSLDKDNEEMGIKIYSDIDDLVYTGKIVKNKENIVGKVYDFSTSKKGIYTIVINTGGRRFVEYIQI